MKILFSEISFYQKAVLKDKLNVSNANILNTGLLIQAYEKWGTSLLSHLDGDFSFVLYDPLDTYYFAARDSLGVKALYFTKIDKDYKFSSNIDDLLKLQHTQKKPNLKSMETMLYQRTVGYSDTMYKGIYRLPPGHYMTIKDGKAHIERYWYPEKIKRNYTISEEKAAKTLTVLLLKAIDKRTANLDETAFQLSGGLDSSSIVSLRSQNLDNSILDTYSMGFKSLKCDEGEYIESMLDKYSLHHQNIAVGKLDYHERYSLGNLYDMSPNWPIILTFATPLPMIEKMKHDGKKIVITGDGGDHIFTGTPYVLFDLFRRLKFLTLYRELKFYPKPWSIIKSYIIAPFLGEKVTMYIKKLLRKSKVKNPFFDVEIESFIDLKGKKNLAFQNDLDYITSTQQSMLMDGNIFHCAENYFDVEHRHPYYDRELVEFALSLPPEMKYKNRTIKWILRKAMDGILPDKIRDRKDKAEFSEVITQQIDAIDLDTVLKDPYIVKLGLIEQSLINKHRKEYEEKTSKYILILWTIINVEYWYRYNFEEESLAKPTV